MLDGPQMFKYGTSSITGVANMLNTFPYKNRTEGQSPDAQTLSGERIHESFEERGGGMHNCMTGCIVSCSNIVHDKDGNYKTSALEFETLTLAPIDRRLIDTSLLTDHEASYAVIVQEMNLGDLSVTVKRADDTIEATSEATIESFSVGGSGAGAFALGNPGLGRFKLRRLEPAPLGCTYLRSFFIADAG